MQFPGREQIFWLYLATLMVPTIVTLIPLFIILRTFGLINTWAGLVIPFVLGTPFGIFLMRQFFLYRLDEGAQLDLPAFVGLYSSQGFGGVSRRWHAYERELETVVQDEAAGRGCPFCRVRAEIVEDAYEVAANTTWQAFLPPYVRYPYETHLYPRRHVANLGVMGDKELRDFAAILLRVIRGYNALFDGAMAPMPYLLGIHQLADERFHLHVEIQAIGRAPGKLKYAASSESLWGVWNE